MLSTQIGITQSGIMESHESVQYCGRHLLFYRPLEEELMPFSLTSTAFEEGQPIPKEYTGEGKNFSPPLQSRNRKNLYIITDPSLIPEEIIL